MVFKINMPIFEEDNDWLNDDDNDRDDTKRTATPSRHRFCWCTCLSGVWMASIFFDMLDF